MRKPNIAVLVAAGAAAVVLTGPPARADEPAGTPNAATRTDIDLAGQVVMRIREGAGGYTAGQRAEIIRTRLIPILSNSNLRAEDITVSGPASGPTIYVNGQQLITIDGNLARYNKTTPAGLAQSWAANLRRVLPEAVASGARPNGVPGVSTAGSAASP